MLPRGGCFQRSPRVSQNETHLSKSKICIVLKLFPNTSTVLEQMHVFKTSGVAELAVCQETQNPQSQLQLQLLKHPDVSTPAPKHMSVDRGPDARDLTF